MSKAELDLFFLSQMDKMKEIIPKTISKYKKFHLETDVVIAETYIHLINKIDLIHDESIAKSFLITFIQRNIMWEFSQINKKETVNNFTDDWQPNEQVDDIDDALLDKINIENWYNEKRAICELYRMQEKDKYKCIIYDCYFHKGLTKGVALAKHLRVNKDYGCSYVKQLKLDLFNFYLAYKDKPNNIYYKGII